MRCLDIGPGEFNDYRIPGFETLDIQPRKNVDYIADASNKLPFDDDVFDIIHASHILEHIFWQYTQKVVNEWVRILKPKGVIEIWVPNGMGIFKSWQKAEQGNLKNFKSENGKLWERREKDDWAMANGLLLTATGIKTMPWGIHKAIFSKKSLSKIMMKAGLIFIEKMNVEDIREIKLNVSEKKNWMRRQMWANLGLKGVKKNNATLL